MLRGSSFWSSALVGRISFVRRLCRRFKLWGFHRRQIPYPPYTQFLNFKHGFAEKRGSRASFGGRTDENNLSVYFYKTYGSHKPAKFQLGDYEKRESGTKTPRLRHGPLAWSQFGFRVGWHA